MKRGATDHPKMHAFARIMNIPQALAIGYMELLWHFTAKYAPQGDVGRHTDAAIAKACLYQGVPSRLVSAMCAAGWLTPCQRYRLCVHDWGVHADQGVKRSLQGQALSFVVPEPIKTSIEDSFQLASRAGGALPLKVDKPVPLPSARKTTAKPAKEFPAMEGPDPQQEISKMIDDIATTWLDVGNVPRAKMVAQHEWAKSEEPIEKWVKKTLDKAALWQEYHQHKRSQKPKHFVPYIEKWFTDGDYSRSPAKNGSEQDKSMYPDFGDMLQDKYYGGPGK